MSVSAIISDMLANSEATAAFTSSAASGRRFELEHYGFSDDCDVVGPLAGDVGCAFTVVAPRQGDPGRQSYDYAGNCGHASYDRFCEAGPASLPSRCGGDGEVTEHGAGFLDGGRVERLIGESRSQQSLFGYVGVAVEVSGYQPVQVVGR